jgi:hypothetical protein
MIVMAVVFVFIAGSPLRIGQFGRIMKLADITWDFLGGRPVLSKASCLQGQNKAVDIKVRVV